LALRALRLLSRFRRYSPRRLNKFHVISVDLLHFEVVIPANLRLNCRVIDPNKNTPRETNFPRGEIVMIAQVTGAHS
jgi:hypothetical protein